MIRDTPNRRPRSDKPARIKDIALAISSILSAVAIPVVGYWVSSALKGKEIEGRFVELAVNILKTEPTESQRSLREWATDVINNYSGVRLSKEASADLIERTVIPSVDVRTASVLERLQPRAAELARQLVAAARQKGIAIKVISGLRTVEEQDALYAQGRTAPGPIVTTARGGCSNHNTGLSFDIGVFRDDKFIDDQSDPVTYQTVGELGRGLGLVWGGDWKSIKDLPHFETTDASGVLRAMCSSRDAAKSTGTASPGDSPH